MVTLYVELDVPIIGPCTLGIIQHRQQYMIRCLGFVAIMLGGLVTKT